MKHNWLNRIYIYMVSCLAILMFGFITFRKFFPVISSESYNDFYLIFLILGILFIFFFINVFNRFILNKISSRTKEIICLICCILFLLLEIFSLIFFKVEPHWDFKWIMDTAYEVAVKHDYSQIGYYMQFPNNIATFIIVTIVIKIFGGNLIGAYIFNILCILISVVLTYLVAKKIGGINLAVKTLFLALFFTPWYLYSPIVYTDTLSIVLPIAMTYLWLLSKDYETKPMKFYFCWGRDCYNCCGCIFN